MGLAWHIIISVGLFGTGLLVGIHLWPAMKHKLNKEGKDLSKKIKD